MGRAKATRSSSGLGDTIRRLAEGMAHSGSTGFVSADGKTSVAIATNVGQRHGRSVTVVQASTPSGDGDRATDRTGPDAGAPQMAGQPEGTPGQSGR